jgi:hypothetical protein
MADDRCDLARLNLEVGEELRPRRTSSPITSGTFSQRAWSKVGGTALADVLDPLSDPFELVRNPIWSAMIPFFAKIGMLW